MGTFFAGNLRTGQILVRNIPASTGSAQAVLNGAGAITATLKLPMMDPATGVAVPFNNQIGLAKSFLGYAEGNKIINAGPIWTDSYDFDTQVQTINAAGLWSYWKYRFVLPLLADNDLTSLPNGADTNLVNLSYRTIAKRLVQQAQAATAGRLPIVFESDIVDTFVRNYLGSDLNRLDSMLTNLTNIIGGPDIAFRPRFVGGEQNYIEWAMVTGDPELSADEDHVWDMTTVPNPSVKGAKIDRDGTTYVQVDYEQGEAADQGNTGSTLATKSVDFEALEPGRVENIMTDPEGQGGGGGWTAQAGTGGVATVDYQTNGPWLPGDAPPSYVTTAARIRWTTAPTTAPAGLGPTLAVEPGDVYSVMLRVTMGTGLNRAFTLYTRFVDASGGFIGVADGPTQTISVAGEWVNLKNQVTVPPGAFGMQIGWHFIIGGTLPAAGDTVYATAGLAVAGTYTGDFFDGNTPPDDVHDYTFEGLWGKSASAQFLLNGIPRMEDSGNQSTVNQMATLQGYADDATLTGRQLEETWSFSAKIDASPTVQDYDEGDYAVLKFKNEPRVGTAKPRMRITQYKVTLGNTFVDITCAPERADA